MTLYRIKYLDYGGATQSHYLDAASPVEARTKLLLLDKPVASFIDTQAVAVQGE